MSFFERLLFIAYYGPARRPLRWLLRKLFSGSGRVAFGGLRGCEMLNQRLDCRLGIYELHVQDALTRCVAENDVVYDIGANFGFHTLLASRLVGNKGQVIAFEPLPVNLESMKQFLSLMAAQTLCADRKPSRQWAGWSSSTHQQVRHRPPSSQPKGQRSRLRL